MSPLLSSPRVPPPPTHLLKAAVYEKIIQKPKTRKRIGWGVLRDEAIELQLSFFFFQTGPDAYDKTHRGSLLPNWLGSTQL